MANKAFKFNQLNLSRRDNKTKTLMQESMDIIFNRATDRKNTYVPELAARLSERKPRALDQSTSQDWPNIWPAAQAYRSSAVPIPIRMGYVRRPDKKLPPVAYGNLELLKVPNFLHLTPLHLQRHCAAIKKFCTKYPDELKGTDSSELMRNYYFPIHVEYSDYIHQGTNIRDGRAREVKMNIKMNQLKLDTHAYNKFRQLVGERYNEETDWITIESNRCPTRKQNNDFLTYVLTALYHESNKTEPWEKLMIKNSAAFVNE